MRLPNAVSTPQKMGSANVVGIQGTYADFRWTGSDNDTGWL